MYNSQTEKILPLKPNKGSLKGINFKYESGLQGILKTNKKVSKISFYILFSCFFTLLTSENSYSAMNNYKIDAKLNSKQRSLSGTEEIIIYNNSKENLDTIFLSLGLNNSYDTKISITEVTNSDNTILPSNIYRYRYLGKEIEDRAIYQVSLHSILAPNESITLKIKFDVSNLAKINGIIFFDDNINNIFTSNWYPRVINFEDGVWKKKDIDSNNYDLNLIINEDEFPIASAIELNTENLKTGGNKKITYKIDKSRSFSLAVSNYISSETDQTKDGNIIKLYYKNNKASKFNKSILASAKEIMEFYYKIFGFYPYKQLAILPGNNALKGGYANTNMVILHQNYEKFENFKEFEYDLKWNLAYYIAQQYFGHYVGESGEYPKWITSGASLYLANYYVREKNIKVDYFNKVIKNYVDAARSGFNTQIFQTTDEIKNTDFDWENIIEKGKSAQIFKLLEYRLGRKTLLDSLKEITIKYANSFVNYNKFESVLETQSNKKLDSFFAQWVKENKRLDYAVTKIVQNKIGNKYQVKITVKKLGKISMPVSLAITFKNGNKVFQLWEGDRSEAELTYEYNDKVKSVQLDPAETLPDIDLSNNKLDAFDI